MLKFNFSSNNFLRQALLRKGFLYFLGVFMAFYTSVKKKGVEIIAKYPYKIGIVTFMAFPELLKTDEGAADRIKTLVQDPFFELLEVSYIRDSEWNKLQDYVKEEGRGIDFSLGLQPEILSGRSNPSSLNEEERKKAEENLVKLTQNACSRGMKAVALCSGPVVSESDRPKAEEAFKKTVGGIAEEAKKCGIPVFVELFDSKWDKKRLLGPISYSHKIIEDIRSSYPNVYILWDLSHAPMLDEKPEDIKPYADLIGHIHVGCTKKLDGDLRDWHPGFHRPGAINTEKDVADLLKVLHDIGYKGATSFEIKPEEGQLPLEVIYTAEAVLIKAYQMFLRGL